MIQEQNKRRVTEVAVRREAACTSEPPPSVSIFKTGMIKDTKPKHNPKQIKTQKMHHLSIFLIHELPVHMRKKRKH